MKALKVVKRDGRVVPFDESKIVIAVSKASAEVAPINQMNDFQIKEVGAYVWSVAEKADHDLSIEEIQNLVEIEIMNLRKFEVAQHYIRYRYNHEMIRGIEDYVAKLRKAEPIELKGFADAIGDSLRNYFEGRKI